MFLLLVSHDIGLANGKCNCSACVPIRLWHSHSAEYDASASYSASCYEPVEHIRILTIIMAESELCQIQRQILLRYLMIITHDAALEQTPETLKIVCMNYPSDVLAGLVINLFVLESSPREILIRAGFVSCNQLNFLGYYFADKLTSATGRGIVQNFADDIPLAGNRSKGWNFTNLTTAYDLLVRVAILIQTANERIVNFHDAHQLRELIIVHCGTNACAHIPNSFVTRFVVKHHALDLKCAHSLFGMQHQEGDRKPSLEWVFRVLEYRAGNQREAITLFRAFVALPMPSACQLIRFVILAARASRDTIRPAMLKQKLLAGFFSRKEGVEFAQLDHA
jgi:hypothetical protein